jgi:hypothetical protein
LKTSVHPARSELIKDYSFSQALKASAKARSLADPFSIARPIEERKHKLANLLFREQDGIAFNHHYDGDGATIFEHACALGCEGVVSKRLGSPSWTGRSAHWNPAAPL